MKKITTISLLIIMALGCSAQVPDEHNFSQSIIDSLNIIISDLRIENDSLKDVNPNLIIADDFTVTVIGETDSTKSTISKDGLNISTSIQIDNKRLISNFTNGARDVWFANDVDTTTYAKAHVKLDSTDFPEIINFER